MGYDEELDVRMSCSLVPIAIGQWLHNRSAYLLASVGARMRKPTPSASGQVLGYGAVAYFSLVFVIVSVKVTVFAPGFHTVYVNVVEYVVVVDTCSQTRYWVYVCAGPT